MGDERGLPLPGQTIRGLVERITYHNPENGYTVAKLAVAGQPELVTVIGHFGSLTAGEAVKIMGSWGAHPKHGPQFKAHGYEVEKPATLVGLEKYLGSGLIKGVGPKTARRLVKHFGMEILDIIEHTPERLNEVRGVGPHRVAMIGRAWQDQKRIKEVMLFLQTHGVSTTYAVKIYKTYGDEAIHVVTHDPYRLAKDVWGIGFKTADQIARNLGVPHDAPMRLRAGLLHVLGEASDQGHMAQPRARLLAVASEILGVEAQALEQPLATLALAEDVIVESAWGTAQPAEAGPGPADGDEPLIWLPPLWTAETNLARRLLKLVARPAEVPADLEARLAAVQAEEAIVLSEEQRQAVLAALRNRVFVLTGGPGTGKTTTVRTIVRLLAAYDQIVVLASPTGRAAKRLAEVTGSEAKTLHRLLEFAPDRMAFTRDAERPIEADVVLVDEASMLDALLANSLLKAVPPLGHLILVGDTDQLPSVGPGNVLRDVLASARVPAVELTRVFRQAEASLIVTNAHKIRHGRMPELVVPTGEVRADCYFLEAEDPEEAVRLIVNAVGKSLPRRFGLDPVADIQVLCPMNRGVVGATNLNLRLQDALNPSRPGVAGVSVGARSFRVGDKAIQLRNNYDKQVFNGDMGVIEAIEPEEQTLTLRTVEAPIEYDFSDLSELALAFAITVHKSQGSEFPAVVVPIMTQHYPMLQRNLIYTALTRAKRVAVLVGQKKAIRMAIGQADVARRVTRLKERLEGP